MTRGRMVHLVFTFAFTLLFVFIVVREVIGIEAGVVVAAMAALAGTAAVAWLFRTTPEVDS